MAAPAAPLDRSLNTIIAKLLDLEELNVRHLSELEQHRLELASCAKLQASSA